MQNKQKVEGGIFHVLTVSLPVIISQACDSLMMFTDRYLLSSYDEVSAPASMTGGMTAFVMWVFGCGLLGFITPLVAQYRGAKLEAMSLQVVVAALPLAVILALPIFFFGPMCAEWYFGFLKLPEAEFPLALGYFSVIISWAFMVFLKVILASYYAGIEKTSVVMGISLLGLAINVPLSYFFIHGGFGSSWEGVRGAALGTVLSEILMTSTYLFLFLRSHANVLLLKLDWHIMKKIIVFGTPTGIEFFVLSFAFNSFLMMFHSFGVPTAQAITVAVNWSWLTVLPFFGLSIGIMSLVGNALGASKPELAKKISHSGFWIAGFVLVIASFAFLGFTDAMIAVFHMNAESEAGRIASSMVKTLPLYCLFDALSFVFTATLRAAGDTKYCLWVSVIGQWSCMLICHFGIYYYDFSANLAWNLFIVALSLQSFAYGYRYLQGKWMDIKLI